MTNTDRDLRELFSRLRQEDRARAPSFQAVCFRLGRPSGSPRWALAIVGIAAAAAIVAGVLVAWPEEPRRAPRLAPHATSSLLPRSPTDFLLDTPGSGLLRTVPTFGTARWIGTNSPTLDPRNPS